LYPLLAIAVAWGGLADLSAVARKGEGGRRNPPLRDGGLRYR
jgi:hypothetical protein